MPAPAPASAPAPERASFGFDDGPIGGARPKRAESTDSGALPVVRTNPADPVAEAMSAPAPAPWTPVPFEPAAPRPAGVDGWGSPSATGIPPEWAGQSRTEPAVWSDTPAAAPPAPRRQSRLVTFGMSLLGAVALAAIALTGVVYYSGPDTEIGEMLQLGGGDGGDQRTVTGPLDGRTIATFELLAATDRVRVSIADLGADLYRVTTPEQAGGRPHAEVREDRLLVDLSRDEGGPGGEVEVVLAAKVRWTLRFSGYAAERVVDTSNGQIDRIEMVGGTRRAELNLADASGTVPMKITGGVEELLLRAPADNPVRVRVGAGAGTVTAGSRTLRDLKPGSTLTPKDWQKADRYDVDAASVITVLTVEERVN